MIRSKARKIGVVRCFRKAVRLMSGISCGVQKHRLPVVELFFRQLEQPASLQQFTLKRIVNSAYNFKLPLSFITSLTNTIDKRRFLNSRRYDKTLKTEQNRLPPVGMRYISTLFPQPKVSKSRQAASEPSSALAVISAIPVISGAFVSRIRRSTSLPNSPEHNLDDSKSRINRKRNSAAQYQKPKEMFGRPGSVTERRPFSRSASLQHALGFDSSRSPSMFGLTKPAYKIRHHQNLVFVSRREQIRSSHNELRTVLPVEIIYRQVTPMQTPQPTKTQLRATTSVLPTLDVTKLSSDVLRQINKQVRIERERQGRL